MKNVRIATCGLARSQARNLVAKAVAFYLPQFHPIPENDRWWGKGFTEWTNVTRARPLFRDHYQPHLPADLGFYDLRLSETREAQAELARQHGIHGFCYYHYWFNGRRILERPFEEVLATGRPDFPFCLCWANENWTRRWDGLDQELLLEQKYSAEDDEAHLRALLPAFADPRYIRVDGKPLFLVYRANRLPSPRASTDRWRNEAQRAGLPGLFLVRVESFEDEAGDPRSLGFDSALEFQPRWKDTRDLRITRRRWWHRRRLGTSERAFRDHLICNYSDVVSRAISREAPPYPRIPCVSPGWDNTARRRKGGLILHGSTPELYEAWLSKAAERVKAGRGEASGGEAFLFINAWNEWAEGNHLEPCQRWGTRYLKATAQAMSKAHVSAVLPG